MSKKIKDEQKKFLGETLNQYDKALDEAINQLDKKNREQNHKISSLVNSFDNEYLEKDVEGNMTTLENSKDGMVIINEIQGSTEVNYCKDGEKELILNGDIDTQGESFVTITEGVDGGLVDVSLEGNTEINLSKTKDPVLVTREFDDINCNVGKLQYTIDDVTTINDEPGKVDIDRIVGDTMVNHAVNGSEELILNAHINESGDNSITLNGVTSDGGKVDVALEGNTLVNVSKTKDSTAITKAYTVENSGNHIALQGEYDGKCRPVVYGNTLVNLWNGNESYLDSCSTYCKTNTTYTFILDLIGTITNGQINIGVENSRDKMFVANGATSGRYIEIITTNDSDSYLRIYRTLGDSGFSFKVIILEGDYTNKPIPGYFEGLQSSFEDKVVTQEMIDSGEEVADNLGKYKVEYKVTGKNKCRIKDDNYTNVFNGLTWTIKNNQIQVDGTSTGISSSGIDICHPNFINGKTYITSTNNNNVIFYISYNDNGTIKYSGGANKTYTHNSNYTDIKCYLQVNASDVTFSNEIINCQLEEGDTTTSYEPYKESIKTLYLNSPLLEGDTIEQQGNNVVHVHRSNSVTFDGSDDEGWYSVNTQDVNYIFTESIINSKIKGTTNQNRLMSNNFAVDINIYQNRQRGIFLNGSGEIRLCLGEVGDVQYLEQWLQQNPTTVVYELASPTYELIEQSNLVIPSYTNGHLDFDTAVPVKKVQFKAFSEKMTYLYANTQYTVQFVSNKAITADITLGGTKLLAQNIVAGLNRISITTPSELANSKLVIDGVGAKISEVVVTNTDRKFGYFEGMKSVGEDEDNKLIILSNNKNLFDKDNEILLGYYWGTDGLKGGNGVYDDINHNFADNKKYNCVGYKYMSFLPTNIEGRQHISRICFYTKDDKFISQSQGNDLFNVVVPPNAEYLKLCADYVLINHYVLYGTTEKLVGTPEDWKNYIPHQSNSQQLTHEPLRAVRDAKDRYVLIDGKWYIERNVVKLTFDGNDSSREWGTWLSTGIEQGECVGFYSYVQGLKHDVIENDAYTTVLNDNLPFISLNDIRSGSKEGIATGQGHDKGYFAISINKNKLNNITPTGFNEWLNRNPITIVAIGEPYYEPIDYNPLEVYSDITHITTNSTIPTNITIKNHGYNLVALKENTQYTLYVNKDTTNALTYRLGDYVEINSPSKFTFTTPSTLTDKTLRIDGKGAKVKDLMLIEGTPTNDSIGYFDGLKSSYECEKVTDESDENYGKYKVETIVRGKNLFDINKLTPNASVEFTSNGFILTKTSKWSGIGLTHFKVKKYTDYIFKFKVLVTSGKANFTIRDNILNTELKGMTTILPSSEWIEKTIKWNSQERDRIILYFYSNFSNSAIDEANVEFKDIQIEEGTEATEYEPYFESKQTVYLNSPLLKGDEIVWKDNKIQHYHKMKAVVFDGSDDEEWRRQPELDNDTTERYWIEKINNNQLLDVKINTISYNDKFDNIAKNNTCLYTHPTSARVDLRRLKTDNRWTDLNSLKQWLQANPVTVVYELETPYYEEISDYPLKLNVIANSSLSTESTIQVTNISFNIYEETLPYLYPNTKYYITFNADVDRNNIIIDLGGNHVVFDCKVGFNKVEITTPSDTTNLLTFSGTGVNIDHVKVTQQNIDEYFEGMKSVGECENNTLEIICKNDDNSKSNTQTLTHEPLRSVGEIKDKYVLIDGKWYIERNTKQVTFDGSENWWDYQGVAGVYGLVLSDKDKGYNTSKCNIFKNTGDSSPFVEEYAQHLTYTDHPTTANMYFDYNLGINNIALFKQWLSNNRPILIYKLKTPIYEPIDYNPFEVYSDTTHITTNSLIPTNVVVKNHGYNCILKPSTTYTIALNKSNGTISAKLGGSAKVDSTNSIFTITTPNTLNDNVLRLSGSGNIKDIMILEGDKTVNTPSYFEGIESGFEQEYDTEKGKYRVTARVEGNGKKSSIVFYLNEPLRGTGTAKDKVYIKDGKVIVQRNCGSYTFDGSEEGWGGQEDKGKFIKFSKEFSDFKFYLGGSHKLYCNTLCTNTNIVETDLEQLTLYCHNENTEELRFNLSKAKLSQLNVEGFKQWLQANPTTVVYALAEPVYEEADCDLSKLVLENYENSSLIFESNIPVSANIKYSGEVPVVTQAKALSSKVDNTTFDINENIIPYMCDIDYRIVELQLMNGDTQGEGIELLGIGDIEILGNENVLFNNREDKKHNFSYDMLKRDILSQRYSKEEYQYRLDRYLLANKISDEEYKELEGLLNNGK